jgi:hypothetical protein
MTVLAIDINDAGLVVANDSALLAAEPGFARIDRGKVVTGDAAKAGARLQPRQTSNRFWSTLSLEPGSAGADSSKSAAELAYAQLESLWSKVGNGVADIVLVVPGAYRTDQLGVLLGLTQECGMPVRALVDTAAAVSVRPYPGRQLVYVDAGLHRASVTLLEQDAAEVQVRAEHALNQGLAGIADAFARRIADLFVRSTRFDPFTHAETEQQVYDRLPEWLALLQREERAELELQYRDEKFRAPAERDAVLGVAHGFCHALAQLVGQQRERGKNLVVQVSERLAALPGLLGELARLDDAQTESFEAGHAARSALLARALIAAPSSAQVKFVKRLAWRAGPMAESSARQPSVQTPVAARETPPTHLVYGGLAYRVGTEGVVVGRETDPKRRTLVVGASNSGVSRAHCEVVLRDGELKLRDMSSFGTFVNERKVVGETTLERADVIRIGSPGAELHVVSLEGGA